MEKKRNFSCIDELKLHSYSIGTTPFEVAKEEGFLSETESVEFFLVTLDGRFHFFDKGGNSIIRPRKDFELTEDSIPNKEYLVSLKIPDCVTRIGNEAFYGCTNLTSVTIPDSVTSIGESAFRGCTALTSVTIPDGVTRIGYSMFSYCSGMTSVTIPNSVTSIWSCAFYSCIGLTGVTIPASVTSIGYCAFFDCSGLTSVTIPDGATRIGSSAFYSCSGLKRVTIPRRFKNTIDDIFWKDAEKTVKFEFT